MGSVENKKDTKTTAQEAARLSTSPTAQAASVQQGLSTAMSRDGRQTSTSLQSSIAQLALQASDPQHSSVRTGSAVAAASDNAVGPQSGFQNSAANPSQHAQQPSGQKAQASLWQSRYASTGEEEQRTSGSTSTERRLAVPSPAESASKKRAAASDSNAIDVDVAPASKKRKPRHGKYEPIPRTVAGAAFKDVIPSQPKKRFVTKVFNNTSQSSAKPAYTKATVDAAAVCEQLHKTEEARKRVDEELTRFQDQSGRKPDDPAIAPEASIASAKTWLLGAAMTQINEASDSDDVSVRLDALSHVVHTVDSLKKLRLLSYAEVDHTSNILEQYKSVVLKNDGTQMRQNLTLLHSWLKTLGVTNLLPQEKTNVREAWSLQIRFSQFVKFCDLLIKTEIAEEASEDGTTKEQTNDAREAFSGLYTTMVAKVQEALELRSRNRAVVKNIGCFLTAGVDELVLSQSQRCNSATDALISYAVEQILAESQRKLTLLGA